ncbi:MAG: ThiF family adenylyltransferase [Tildeniella nuda ZEHNDER 1965/U140]|jgi:hypothetical protein|nr:ThiF family adenylyltransferase [Tildeniella nuda ZEHNDER 1965/U140]
MTTFFHEQLYRTDTVVTKLKEFPVTICGAGALGANLAENLARAGFGKLKVIDRDRIEKRNLSTQPYYRSNVGAFKAKILANNLYRAIGTKVEAEIKALTATNAAQLLKDSELIDCARAALGYDETVRQLLKQLRDCPPTALIKTAWALRAALRRQGSTVFDWLVDAINNHPNVELVLVETKDAVEQLPL